MQENAFRQTIQNVCCCTRAAAAPVKEGSPSIELASLRGCGAYGPTEMLRALEDVPQGGARWHACTAGDSKIFQRMSWPEGRVRSTRTWDIWSLWTVCAPPRLDRGMPALRQKLRHKRDHLAVCLPPCLVLWQGSRAGQESHEAEDRAAGRSCLTGLDHSVPARSASALNLECRSRGGAERNQNHATASSPGPCRVHAVLCR